jgi:hypothetical protein
MNSRRIVLRGLVAAPAVVAIGSLMPIRGIIMPIEGTGHELRLKCLIERLKEDGIWHKLERVWLFHGQLDQLLYDGRPDGPLITT